MVEETLQMRVMDLGMARLSRWAHCSHNSPYRREAGDQCQKQWDDRSRDWSDVTMNQGMQVPVEVGKGKASTKK